MDGWIIGLVVGGVLLLGLVVVLRVVVKAAATTAETAQAILVALEDLRSTTAPLAQLGRLDPETLGPELSGENRLQSRNGEAMPPSGNGSGTVNPGTGAEEQRETEG